MLKGSNAIIVKKKILFLLKIVLMGLDLSIIKSMLVIMVFRVASLFIQQNKLLLAKVELLLPIIGIFLKKGSHHTGIGTMALKLVMRKNPNKRYLANIHPKNKKSIEFFKKNNFKILQYTYELNCD